MTALLTITVSLIVARGCCASESITSVRLLGETDPTSLVGYVQVLVNGRWRTVCDHGWNEPDATTVCTQQGFDRGVPFGIRELVGTPPSEPFLQKEFKCLAHNRKLQECNTGAVSKECKAAIVSCDRKNNTLVNGSIRLINGDTPSSGRVEVSYNGLWGGICDRRWDEASAGTVCTMLDIASSGTPVHSSGFGRPHEVFLDPVQCSGGQTNITQCTDRGWLGDTCTLIRTAGVVCHDDKYSNLTGSVRLIGGASKAQGYLEISFYGVWGLVCGNEWTNVNSRVVCRQLGYKTGRTSTDKFLLSEQIVWTDFVGCEGNESALAACTIPKWEDHLCTYQDLVKIQCTNMDDFSSTSSPIDDRMRTVYIVVVAVCVVMVIVVIVIVVKVKQKRQLIVLKPRTDEDLIAAKLGPKLSDSRNPVYHIDTSLPASDYTDIHPTSDTMHKPVYQYRQENTGLYNDIQENQIYLDIIDDDENKSILPMNRANTPLPDIPDDAPSKRDTSERSSSGQLTHTDTGYLTPSGVNKHKYVNIQDVSNANHEKNINTDQVLSRDEDCYVKPIMQHARSRDNVCNNKATNPFI